MIEPLLTEEDAARLLGTVVGTLRNWRVVGRGPAFVKVGRNVRYNPADLQTYIDARTRRPIRGVMTA